MAEDFGTFESQTQSLNRRRKLAEILQSQAFSPVEGAQGGGRTSPLAAVAKMLAGYLANQENKAVDTDTKALGDVQTTAFNEGMARMPTDTPAMPAQPAPPDELGGGPAAPAQAARGVSPLEMMKWGASQMQTGPLGKIVGGRAVESGADRAMPKVGDRYKVAGNSVFDTTAGTFQQTPGSLEALKLRSRQLDDSDAHSKAKLALGTATLEETKYHNSQLAQNAYERLRLAQELGGGMNVTPLGVNAEGVNVGVNAKTNQPIVIGAGNPNAGVGTAPTPPAPRPTGTPLIPAPPQNAVNGPTAVPPPSGPPPMLPQSVNPAARGPVAPGAGFSGPAAQTAAAIEQRQLPTGPAGSRPGQILPEEYAKLVAIIQDPQTPPQDREDAIGNVSQLTKEMKLRGVPVPSAAPAPAAPPPALPALPGVVPGVPVPSKNPLAGVIPKEAMEKEVASAMKIHSAIDQHDQLLQVMKEAPGAFDTKKNAAAKAAGWVGLDGMAKSRLFSKDEIAAQALVGLNSAKLMKELFGASQTLGEAGRAAGFELKPSDPPDVIMAKVDGMMKLARTQLSGMSEASRVVAAQRRGAKPEAAPSKPRIVEY